MSVTPYTTINALNENIHTFSLMQKDVNLYIVLVTRVLTSGMIAYIDTRALIVKVEIFTSVLRSAEGPSLRTGSDWDVWVNRWFWFIPTRKKENTNFSISQSTMSALRRSLSFNLCLFYLQIHPRR